MLERAEQLKRRKEIYEEMYPESRQFSSEKQSARRSKEPSEIISHGFTVDTARKTGLSQRTIQQDIHIAKNIAPEVKETIRNTPLADNKTELLHE